MTDRISTEVLGNGALRYAEYDSGGNFIQYRYLLLDDEPTQAGTPLSKANLLTDATARMLMNASAAPNATVNGILNELAFKAVYTTTYTGTGPSTTYNSSITFTVPEAAASSLCNFYIIIDAKYSPYSMANMAFVRRGSGTYTVLVPTYVNIFRNYTCSASFSGTEITLTCSSFGNYDDPQIPGMNQQGAEYIVIGLRLDE